MSITLEPSVISDWRIRRLAYVNEWPEALLNHVAPSLPSDVDEALAILQRAAENLCLSVLRGKDTELEEQAAKALGFMSYDALQRFLGDNTAPKVLAPKFGQLARDYCNKHLPLAVLKSNAGFYIGTFDDEGPCSRESVEYFPTQALADKALESGNWTQKPYP